MDGEEMQSCGSISSTDVISQMHDCAAGSIKQSLFIYHGLLLWIQGRQKWTGDKKPVNQALQWHIPKLRNLCLCTGKRSWLHSWNVPCDSFLKSNKPFPKPTPLGEVVDLSVDTWERKRVYWLRVISGRSLAQKVRRTIACSRGNCKYP